MATPEVGSIRTKRRISLLGPVKRCVDRSHLAQALGAAVVTLVASTGGTARKEPGGTNQTSAQIRCSAYYGDFNGRI